jgi:hypothetical protein
MTVSSEPLNDSMAIHCTLESHFNKLINKLFSSETLSYRLVPCHSPYYTRSPSARADSCQNVVRLLQSGQVLQSAACLSQPDGFEKQMNLSNIPATTPRQKRFLERLNASHQRLMQAIDGLEPEILCTAIIYNDWTVKDLLGHIVSWNDEFRIEIELILNGQHPGYQYLISGQLDFNEWNQRWIAEKREWSLQRIFDDLERDHQQQTELILRLKPKDFRRRGVTPWRPAALHRPENPTKKETDSVDTLVTYHWRHSNQHAHQIEKWRKRVLKV